MDTASFLQPIQQFCLLLAFFFSPSRFAMLRRTLCHNIYGALEASHASECNSGSFFGSGLAMPRQPLSYVRPKAKFRFPANALAERPELAVLIGQCIAIWSQVEAQLAILLSAVMKTDTAIASAVFLSIRNSRAQREALSAAAKIGLTGRELEMFSAIALVYQSLDAQRTDLAHGVFGISEEMPDSLLWADSKDYTNYNIENWIEHTKQRGIPLDPLQRSDEAFRPAIFVYRSPDLTSLREEIRQFWAAVFLFGVHLRISSHFPGDDSEFQKLYEIPPIERALSRLREGS